MSADEAPLTSEQHQYRSPEEHADTGFGGT